MVGQLSKYWDTASSSPPGTDALIQGFTSSKNKDEAWISLDDMLKVVKTLYKKTVRGRSFKISNSKYEMISDLYSNKTQIS